jgi:uncharacterized membrane protein YesL
MSFLLFRFLPKMLLFFGIHPANAAHCRITTKNRKEKGSGLIRTEASIALTA